VSAAKIERWFIVRTDVSRPREKWEREPVESVLDHHKNARFPGEYRGVWLVDAAGVEAFRCTAWGGV
jgi:hypothetical protein